jgi:hypothetical protein
MKEHEKNSTDSGWLTNRHTGKAYQTEPKPRRKVGEVAGRFVKSGKRQESGAKRAWPSMQRALRDMERPALYSLSLTTHLGLEERHEAPDGLFNPVAIELIRGKLQRAFADTFYFAVEVGECGRLHAHVIACVDSCLLDLPDDGETCKPIAKGTEYTTFKYFHKEAPQLPELIQAHKAALKRHGGRLPFVRGFVRLERLQTTRRRSMWISHDWRRTRKTVQNRAASKVRLRTMGNKAKPNYHGLYRDSPTEWDIASFAGFSRPLTKPKKKRYTAHAEPLRA